jgi:membrane protein insertase Oxa1/YidC/SpoIIIJ
MQELRPFECGNSSFTLNLVIAQWTVPNIFNGLLLLPILSGVTQIIMTKVTTGNQPQQPSANGAPNTGKFMQWFFPIFSVVICLGYSAIFSLYWVTGNVLSMIQTIVINKVLDKKEQMAAPVAGEGSVR